MTALIWRGRLVLARWMQVMHTNFLGLPGQPNLLKLNIV